MDVCSLSHISSEVSGPPGNVDLCLASDTLGSHHCLPCKTHGFLRRPFGGRSTQCSSTGDTIQLGIAQTAALSASVVGLEGNDVINFGAQGKIVTGSGSIGSNLSSARRLTTGKTATGTYIISAAVMGSSRFPPVRPSPTPQSLLTAATCHRQHARFPDCCHF